MPYLIPSRTPLVSEQVERAFAHIPALQMGGGTGVGVHRPVPMSNWLSRGVRRVQQLVREVDAEGGGAVAGWGASCRRAPKESMNTSGVTEPPGT